MAGAATTVVTGYATDYLKAVKPPGEEADRKSDEEAVRAVFLRERNVSIQGERWIFPYQLSTRPDIERAIVQGFPDEDQRIRFFYQNGAVDADVTLAKLILEGRRNSGVRVIGLRAKMHRKSDPLSNCTLLTPGPQGEGGSAMIGFDLDSKDISAREIAKQDEFVDVYDDEYFLGPYFGKTTVSLTRTEQQVFQIIARTTKHYVEWYIEVVVLDGNRERTYQLGVNDSPIKTSALMLESSYAEVYLDRTFTDSQPPEGVFSSTFVRVR